jgi:hypothetical protein
VTPAKCTRREPCSTTINAFGAAGGVLVETAYAITEAISSPALPEEESA